MALTTNTAGELLVAKNQGEISATATLTNVAASITSVQLLAANTSRESWMIYNDSTSIAYINFGATASATAFSVKMIADSFYESKNNVYTGIINIIWVAANGSARVTELSA